MASWRAASSAAILSASCCLRCSSASSSALRLASASSCALRRASAFFLAFSASCSFFFATSSSFRFFSASSSAFFAASSSAFLAALASVYQSQCSSHNTRLSHASLDYRHIYLHMQAGSQPHASTSRISPAVNKFMTLTNQMPGKGVWDGRGATSSEPACFLRFSACLAFLASAFCDFSSSSRIRSS